MPTHPAITSARLIVGMEIHVELATRTKMFTRVASPASAELAHADAPPPNTLIDPVVLGLPGALPVLNRAAIDMSIQVGLSLGCQIAPFTKWDRKSYFYPDLPKNYQISQYDLPLCFDGAIDIPDPSDPAGVATHRIGIIRAHLEEDAGKLLHDWPGGGAIDFSIADYNRAGTPLLEIVTAPDFTTADQAVVFAQMLRNTCRFLGVTEGIMQKGHMRFEPNINMILSLEDGHEVRTPIVEVKNLNSFKSLRGAIEYEAREQPARWQADGRVMGKGAKSTRGWDDDRQCTFLQREKEDAHDYRYFPDPDLLPVTVGADWVERLRATLPEPPHAREKRYIAEYALKPKEARALVEERDVCLLYESVIDAAVAASSNRITSADAGRLAANIVLQNCQKRANERAVLVSDLGARPIQLGAIIALREAGEISAAGLDELVGACCDDPAADPRALAQSRNLLLVRDTGALESWCDAVLADPALAKAVADVKSGKDAAVGRLVGEVMKRSGGKADAASARAMLLAKARD